MVGIGGERISLDGNNFLVLFEITIISFFFFFCRNRGGFFHVIFDESQSVERTIGLGGKKFRNRRNGRVILQYFEIDDLGMYC